MLNAVSMKDVEEPYILMMLSIITVGWKKKPGIFLCCYLLFIKKCSPLVLILDHCQEKRSYEENLLSKANKTY